MQTPATRQQEFPYEAAGSFATSTAITPAQPALGCDPELSEILNTVIDIVPDYQGNILGMIPEPSVNVTPIQPQSQQDINEKMAINAITKSLMQFESNAAFNNNPPAYSMQGIGSQSNQQVCNITIEKSDFFFIHIYLMLSMQGYPPPPVYTQRPIRMNNNSNSPQQRMQYQQMHRDRMQQQQKERLLQQQQKQSLVVPVNATAGADQLCKNCEFNII